jgi:mono/diheme cytochrome c family protein
MKKTGIVLTVISLVVMAIAALAFTSFAQNANSSSTTNVNKSDTRQITPPAGQQSGGSQPDFSKNTWELPSGADKTKNPVATSADSVQKGKDLYLARDKGNCVFCHGTAGSGNEETAGRMRRKPADISNKERMDSMTDGEVFWKISKGITGIMPAGEKRMTEEERWNVINYIRTLVKEPAKP